MPKQPVKPGYSIRATRGGGLVFKSRGDFDLRNAPELQALGLSPPPKEEPAPQKRLAGHRADLVLCDDVLDADAPTQPKPGAVLNAPAPCACGAPLPWHLVAIAGAKFSHVCSCRNGYVWGSKTALRFQGQRKNPFIDPPPPKEELEPREAAQKGTPDGDA